MRRIWAFVPLLFLLSVLTVCNGGTVDGDGDGDADADSDIDGDSDADGDGVDCPGGCPAGQRCVGGRCVSTCTGSDDCPPPYQCCDGVCVNVTENVEHCGACGNACAPYGNACFGSTCACNSGVACTPPNLCCGDDGCVNTDEDEDHCGACNQVCDGNCVEGACERCSPDAHETEGGNTCADAQPLGSISDAEEGEQQVLTGNLYPDGDRDCFWFTAEDSEDAECDRFHVDIRFTDNPDGQFALEVYRGSCESPECPSDPITNYSWATDFILQEGEPEDWRGECPCRVETEDGGTQQCSDNTAVFRFCVVRNSGDPAACGWYEVEVSNGVYSTEVEDEGGEP